MARVGRERRRGAGCPNSPDTAEPGHRGEMGFRQAAERDDRVDPGDGGGDEEGDVRAAEGGQRADRRAEHEADTERRPQQAQQSRPVVRLGNVGHRRLGDRHARARCAIHDAPEEQQPHRSGEAGEQAADRGAAQREDEHRLATEAIGQPAHDRREEHLDQGERTDDQADRRRRDRQVAGVAGQDRQHDAEADEVDGHRGPDGAEPGR